MERTYTFREVTSTEELEQFFKLRYAIYEKSRVCPFLKPNDKKLDMDVFDIHSHHYGLFHESNPAGYLKNYSRQKKIFKS